MDKLLIYIVSYQRKSYTCGTIEALSKVLPQNSEIIICDNGSTDGTREWLEENQKKYNLGLLFPDENLRVGGAWTLLTNYFKHDDYDYILLLDNDGWILPDKEWFSKCLELFDADPKIGSLGLELRPTPGYYSMAMTPDPNYKNKQLYKDVEYYDTIFYAAFRLDKFSLWHQTMSNWAHKFIGDKIGRHYNSLGWRTLQYLPGIIVDISQYNFTNPNHEEYNRLFYAQERNLEGDKYDAWLKTWEEKVSLMANPKEYIQEIFGEEYLQYLNL
jgi:glycosyltransferase involved in cell wall biosynthesis